METMRRVASSRQSGVLVTRSETIAWLTAKGQPCELELQELYGRDCRTFKNAPFTRRALYQQSRSDETFLVYEDA